MRTVPRKNKVYIYSPDPYLAAYNEADNSLICKFDFYSENEYHWNDLADEALKEAGYKRIAYWQHDGDYLICEARKIVQTY